MVAVNTADVDPAFTITEPGAWSAAFVFDSVMAVPPPGAAAKSVTVQVAVAFWPKLVGLQDSEETSVGTTRFRVVVAEVLNVAVMLTV